MNLQTLTSALPKPWLTINCEELKTSDGPVRSLVFSAAAGAINLTGAVPGLQLCRPNNTLIPEQAGVSADFYKAGTIYQYKIIAQVTTLTSQRYRVVYTLDPLLPPTIWDSGTITIDTAGGVNPTIITADVYMRLDGIAGSYVYSTQTVGYGQLPITTISGGGVDTTIAYPNAGFYAEWLDLAPTNILRAVCVGLIG